MKRLLIIFLLIGICHAQELLRPTAEDSSASASLVGCSGGPAPSSSMSLAYDAAGLTTFSQQITVKAYKGSQSKVRRFLTWGIPGGAYSSLTLNVNSRSFGWIVRSSGAGDGSACVAYSIDAGHTWTSIVCDDLGTGWTRATNSITLSPTQDLTKLQVAVCTGASAFDAFGDSGGDDVSVFDIWTLGTTSSAPAGNGSSSGLPHRGVVIAN